ncbi:MAG: hypothetical protein KAS39_02465, partial [Actinomycetia bacterium]|nr:hypothetical protein [Actinomycetes bacterium]
INMEKAIELAEKLGVGALISGSYSATGKDLEIKMETIDVKTSDIKISTKIKDKVESGKSVFSIVRAASEKMQKDLIEIYGPVEQRIIEVEKVVKKKKITKKDTIMSKYLTEEEQKEFKRRKKHAAARKILKVPRAMIIGGVSMLIPGLGLTATGSVNWIFRAITQNFLNITHDRYCTFPDIRGDRTSLNTYQYPAYNIRLYKVWQDIEESISYRTVIPA